MSVQGKKLSSPRTGHTLVMWLQLHPELAAQIPGPKLGTPFPRKDPCSYSQPPVPLVRLLVLYIFVHWILTDSFKNRSLVWLLGAGEGTEMFKEYRASDLQDEEVLEG